MSHKQLKVTMRLSPNELDRLIKEETQKRRKTRILQVREQCKVNAAKIREDVRLEKERLLVKMAHEIENQLVEEKNEKLSHLEQQYNNTLKSIGAAHRTAINKPESSQSKLRRQQAVKQAADKRYKVAMKKQLSDKARQNYKENKHIISRRAALEAERLRAAEVASLPPPLLDPIDNALQQTLKPVEMTNLDAFSVSHYHIPECAVVKAGPEEQTDGKSAGEAEDERLKQRLEEKKRSDEERIVRAKIRGQEAIKKERLKHEYDAMLQDLSLMQRADRKRRQDIVADLPKQVFIPANRRVEDKADRQRDMEQAFEDMYLARNNYAGDIEMTLDPHHMQDSPITEDSLEVSELPDNCELLSQTNHLPGNATEDERETTQNTQQENVLRKLLNRLKDQKAEYSVGMADKSAQQTSSELPRQPDISKQGQCLNSDQLVEGGRENILRKLLNRIEEQKAEYSAGMADELKSLDKPAQQPPSELPRQPDISKQGQCLNSDQLVEGGRGVSEATKQAEHGKSSHLIPQREIHLEELAKGGRSRDAKERSGAGQLIEELRDHRQLDNYQHQLGKESVNENPYFQQQLAEGYVSQNPDVNFQQRLAGGYVSQNPDVNFQQRLAGGYVSQNPDVNFQQRLAGGYVIQNPDVNFQQRLAGGYVIQNPDVNFQQRLAGGYVIQNPDVNIQQRLAGGYVSQNPDVNIQQRLAGGSVNQQQFGGVGLPFNDSPAEPSKLQQFSDISPLSEYSIPHGVGIPSTQVDGSLNIPVSRSYLPNTKHHLPVSGSHLPVSGSYLPTKHHLLPSGSHLPVSGSHLPVSGSHLPVSGSYLPVSGSYLPTKDHLPVSGSYLSTKDHLPVSGSYLPTKDHLPVSGSYLPTKDHLPVSGSYLPTKDHLPVSGSYLPTKDHLPVSGSYLTTKDHLSVSGSYLPTKDHLPVSGSYLPTKDHLPVSRSYLPGTDRSQQVTASSEAPPSLETGYFSMRNVEQSQNPGHTKPVSSHTTLAAAAVDPCLPQTSLAGGPSDRYNPHSLQTSLAGGPSDRYNPHSLRSSLSTGLTDRCPTSLEAQQAQMEKVREYQQKILNKSGLQTSWSSDFQKDMDANAERLRKVKEYQQRLTQEQYERKTTLAETRLNIQKQREDLFKHSRDLIRMCPPTTRTRPEANPVDQDEFLSLPAKFPMGEAEVKTSAGQRTFPDPFFERAHKLPDSNDLDGLYHPRSVDMKDLQVTDMVSRLSSLRRAATARDQAPVQSSGLTGTSATTYQQPVYPSKLLGTSATYTEPPLAGSYAPIDTTAIRHKLDSIKKSLCFDDLEESITCTPGYSSVDRFEDSVAADSELTSSSERGSPRLVSASTRSESPTGNDFMDLHQSSLTSESSSSPDQLEKLRLSQAGLWSSQPRITWAELLDSGPSVTSKPDPAYTAPPEPPSSELFSVRDHVPHDLSTIMEVDTPTTATTQTFQTIHENQASATGSSILRQIDQTAEADSFKTLRESQMSAFEPSQMSRHSEEADSFKTLRESQMSTLGSSQLSRRSEEADSFKTLRESQMSALGSSQMSSNHQEADSFKTLRESQMSALGSSQMSRHSEEADSFKTLRESQMSALGSSHSNGYHQDSDTFRTVLDGHSSDIRSRIHRPSGHPQDSGTFGTLGDSQTSAPGFNTLGQSDSETFETLQESLSSSSGSNIFSQRDYSQDSGAFEALCDTSRTLSVGLSVARRGDRPGDVLSTGSGLASGAGVIPGKAKRALEFSLSPTHPPSDTSDLT